MAPPQNPDPLLETFAAELRARREATALSRNRLAEALGCSPQWIAKVENCEKPPSSNRPRPRHLFHDRRNLPPHVGKVQ